MAPPQMPGSDRIEVSAVVPCHNEQGNVPILVARLRAALAGAADGHEIILVDDGSRDGTWDEIARLAEADTDVVGLRLLRNFGHQNALLAGLSFARGRAVVSLDGDLQHPPELVPRLIEAWRAGAPIVNTLRRDAADAGWLKRATSRGFYRVFGFLSGVAVSPGSSDFRLLDREILRALLEFAHNDMFLRGSVEWLHPRAVSVEYAADPRLHGSTKYSMARMLRFAATAITSFSMRPLRLGLWLSAIVGTLALLELLYVLTIAFAGNPVPGWASTLGVLSFLFAALFAVIGIMGVYLARIYKLLQGRPAYIVHGSTETPGHTTAVVVRRVGE